MDWIFSSRIKFVGLEPILEVGPGRFLTFWRSLGGSVDEQVVFGTIHFSIKIVGKIGKKSVSLSNNAISSPLVTKK